jgi:hypothetical protein
MGKQLAPIMTTVNAPYSEKLDGATLAYCLSDIDAAKQYPGQVSSFLGEVAPTQQVEFAAAYHIPVDDLKAFAGDFAAWSGESYPFAA